MKVLILFFLAINFANASIPTYDAPEILARASIRDGYNLPAMSFITDSSPVINNHGDLAFKVIAAVDGEVSQGLWVKKAEESQGKIVYIAPNDRLITDPSLSDSGKIVFSLFDDGVTDGLFLYDLKTEIAEQVLNPENMPIQDYTYPQVLNNNNIFFRATDDSNNRIYYEFNGQKLNKILAESDENLGIKSSYLFRLNVNEKGQLAFKSRMGEKGQLDENNPDSIILLSPAKEGEEIVMKVTTIAMDQDSNSQSNFIRFGNSVSLSNNSITTFIGYLPGNIKAIVRAKDNVLTNIAVEGQNGITEIELFTPKVNDQGLILFRAKDKEGKRGIYIADGSSLSRIIGEGDEVQTDLGAGKILYNPKYPGFGGEVSLNNLGEIIFNAVVFSSDDKELGSAIYKIAPKK